MNKYHKMFLVSYFGALILESILYPLINKLFNFSWDVCNISILCITGFMTIIFAIGDKK
jgi:hypothetical protein